MSCAPVKCSGDHSRAKSTAHMVSPHMLAAGKRNLLKPLLILNGCLDRARETSRLRRIVEGMNSVDQRLVARNGGIVDDGNRQALRRFIVAIAVPAEPRW